MGGNGSKIKEPKAPEIITFDQYIRLLIHKIPIDIFAVEPLKDKGNYINCPYCKQERQLFRSKQNTDVQHLCICGEVQKMWMLYDDRQQKSFNNWSKHIQAMRGIANMGLTKDMQSGLRYVSTSVSGQPLQYMLPSTSVAPTALQMPSAPALQMPSAPALQYRY